MSEDSEERKKYTESQRDLRKFAALLAVIFVAILLCSALTGPIFDRVVQPILGQDDENQHSSGAVESKQEEEEAGRSNDPEDQELLPLLEQGESTSVQNTIQYEVQDGETLPQIAIRYGVAVDDIASLNNLVNPYQLNPGDVLIIPVR
jgi:LysM repeat protein